MRRFGAEHAIVIVLSSGILESGGSESEGKTYPEHHACWEEDPPC